MRSKRPRVPDVPEKYVRFKREDWPGGAGQFIQERESWDAAQPRVLYAGSDALGRSWAYEAGPLGDSTDLYRERREARMLAYQVTMET